MDLRVLHAGNRNILPVEHGNVLHALHAGHRDVCHSEHRSSSVVLAVADHGHRDGPVGVYAVVVVVGIASHGDVRSQAAGLRELLPDLVRVPIAAAAGERLGAVWHRERDGAVQDLLVVADVSLGGHRSAAVVSLRAREDVELSKELQAVWGRGLVHASGRVCAETVLHMQLIMVRVLLRNGEGAEVIQRLHAGCAEARAVLRRDGQNAEFIYVLHAGFAEGPPVLRRRG